MKVTGIGALKITKNANGEAETLEFIPLSRIAGAELQHGGQLPEETIGCEITWDNGVVTCSQSNCPGSCVLRYVVIAGTLVPYCSCE